MDEETKGSWLGRLKRVKPIDQYFLTEKCPFSQKRQLKTGNIKVAAGLLLTGAIAFVLFAGGSAERQWKQSEAATTKAEDVSNHGQPVSQSGGEGSVGMGGGWGSGQSIHSSYGRAGGGGGSRQYTSSQIVRGTEGGAGSGFGLPMGSTIPVRLLNTLLSSDASQPVMAEVLEDAAWRNSVLIPAGARVMGTASFDDAARCRALSWSGAY